MFRCTRSKPCGELCTSWIRDTVFSAIHRKNTELGKIGGTFFHYLVPEDIEEEPYDDEWHGKLVSLERTIKSEAGKNEKALGGQRITQSQRSVN